MLPVAAGTTVLYFLESCGWNTVGNKSLGWQTQDRALEEQSAAAHVLNFGLLHTGSSGVWARQKTKWQPKMWTKTLAIVLSNITPQRTQPRAQKEPDEDFECLDNVQVTQLTHAWVSPPTSLRLYCLSWALSRFSHGEFSKYVTLVYVQLMEIVLRILQKIINVF